MFYSRILKILNQAEKQSGTLQKVLGAAFAVAVTVGGTVGPGILRSPGFVAAQAASPAMMLGLWALGGLYALLGTMAMAELCAILPEAGGLYVYAREAFGEAAGVTIGWSDLIATSAAAASIAVTGADFAVALWPGLAGEEVAFSVGAILFFALIQWQGIRASGRAQEWTAVLQTGVLLFLIGCCIWLGGSKPAPAVISVPHEAGWTAFGGAFLALRYIIVDYDGWYSAVYFSEENSESGAGMARSMILGVVVIILTYLAVNASFLYVLPMPQLAASKLAAADVAQHLLGPNGARFVTLISLVMAVAVIHPMILMNSRLAFSMGRAGLMWHKIATVNDAGTPTYGLVLSTSLIIFFTVTGSFEKLSAVGSFMFVVNYASSFLALIVLRRRGADLYRPFKAWGSPWTTMLVIAASVTYLIGVAQNDVQNSIIAVAFLLLAYPVTFAARKLLP